MRIMILMSHQSTWSYAIASYVQEMGHEVHIFDFYGSGERIPLGERSKHLAPDFVRLQSAVSAIHLIKPKVKGLLRYILHAKKLRNVAKKANIEAVLALYGGGFALLAFVSRVRPYFVYVVGSDVLYASKFHQRINRVTWRHAKKVFANGTYLARKALDQSPRASITPLLMGIDPALFSLSDLEKRPFHIICTRTFEGVYNNDQIIRAISLLSEELPEYRVTFAAAGSLLGHSMKMADKILPAHKRNRISFLGGVDHSRIIELLSQSHIYISMSRSDGTSTSLLEAMACGVIPIVADIPQNREWISEETSNGFLVPLDDPAGLARAIEESIRNIREYEKRMKINRKKVEESADSRKTILQLLKDMQKA